MFFSGANLSFVQGFFFVFWCGGVYTFNRGCETPLGVLLEKFHLSACILFR